MSQIATAFVVPADILDGVAPLLAARDYKGFWDRLFPFEVRPEYTYSGYVLVVLTVLLGGEGVELPRDLSSPGAKAIDESGMGLLLSAKRGEAASTWERLEAFSAEAEDLRRYWADFTGKDWEEAGTAMGEGLDFIKQGLLRVKKGEWYLLLVG